MECDKISEIASLNAYNVRKVLSSHKLTDNQKLHFIRVHKFEIANIFDIKITKSDYRDIMATRPLIKFKPVMNSFTKRGDKILLANALGIPTAQINDYISRTTAAIQAGEEFSFLPQDKLDTVQTYVFRHGSKDDVVAFLDYELSKSKNIDKSLHKMFEYGNGGVADYYSRPIHRLDNKTLIKMYNVVDKNLERARVQGNSTEEDNLRLSDYAIKKIYELQNNSRIFKIQRAQDNINKIN